MKILQLSWSLSSGGAERFVVDLSNRLAEYKDTDVLLVTINDDSIKGNKHYLGCLSPKVKYVNLKCKFGASPVSHFRVCQLIRKVNPDIVHAHCGIQWLYLPAMLFLRVKFIYTLHNVADVCLKSKWLKPFDKWLYTHRIVPVTISNTCKSSYERVFGLNNELCITNGREPLEPSGIKPEDIKFIKDKSVSRLHTCGSLPSSKEPRTSI